MADDTVRQNGKEDGRNSRVIVPVPDPTILTTQQLYREMGIIRELLDIKASNAAEALKKFEETSEVRFRLMESKQNDISDASESRFRQAAEWHRDQATMIIHEIKQLRELHDEKFVSILTQFGERDKRLDQLDQANKAAIQSALVGQKELVNIQNLANAAAFAKSEENFSKQIDQIQVILNTITKSTDDKIYDIKSRLDQGQGKQEGGVSTWVMMVGIGGLIFSLLSLIILISHMGMPKP